MPSDAAFDDARRILPMPELMARLGFTPPAIRKCVMSPFRVTNKPHFTLIVGGDGRYRAIDEATGERWDEVDFIRDYKNLSQSDAAKEYLALAGIGREEQRPTSGVGRTDPLPPSPPAPDTPAGPSLLDVARQSLAGLKPMPMTSGTALAEGWSWENCVEALTPEKRQELADWRGWPVEFSDWLAAEKLVGVHEGKWAIPVMNRGEVRSCHMRLDNGDWVYAKGTKVTPLVWGEGESMVIAFESQWDAYVMLFALDAHKNSGLRQHVKVCVSRGAGNAESLKPYYQAKKCVAFQQNDPPLEPGDKLEGNWLWKSKLADAWPGVEWASPPPQHKDLNDWLRAEGAAVLPAAREAVLAPKRERTSKISVNSLLEIQGMDDPLPGAWFGGETIAEGEACAILGEGGVGKSRWTLQLVACMILGRDNFCGIKIERAAYGRRWLFIQGENRLRRLKMEIKTLRESMNLTEGEFQFVSERIHITTLLNPDDFDLDTENPDRLVEISRLINDINPDAVVFDPLQDFTSGDLNSSEVMSKVAKNLLAAARAAMPNRVIVILHHAITGREGAQRATGWDASSFGKGSKALQGKVRGQINIAKMDPDADELKIVIACGKSNNGLRWKPVGAVMNENGVFELDPDFDLDAWREELNSSGSEKHDKDIKVPAEDLMRLIPHVGGIDKASLGKAINEKYGGTARMSKKLVESLVEAGRVRLVREGNFWKLIRKS